MVRRPRRRPGVIDDTLATDAVFEMAPEEILRDATDPEGIRLGMQVVEAARRQLREEWPDVFTTEGGPEPPPEGTRVDSREAARAE